MDHVLFLLQLAPPVCIPDCSTVLYCNTCTIGASGPICSACNPGFYVNTSKNIY